MNGPLFIALRNQRLASVPIAGITSWQKLIAVQTLNLPNQLPITIIWIDEDTGQRRVVRLLPSNAETNLELGIARPVDWAIGLNERVWFLAS